MVTVQRDFTGNCLLSIEYATENSAHIDNFYCPGVNLWRDVFTQNQLDILIGREVGEKFLLEDEYQLCPYDPTLRKHLMHRNWAPPKGLVPRPEPRQGRWYPKGYLTNVAGVFPQTTEPMRLVDVNDEWITADLNHPLAGRDLRIYLQIVEMSPGRKERGERCSDWISEASENGPGMQLFPEEGEIDFAESGAMERLSQSDDTYFYKQPRLVDHVDAQAREHLYQFCSSIIAKEMRVLDLMSSVQSHLPPCRKLTGLGMNEAELQANPSLTDYLVHDLNLQPQLPYHESSYDAVCCHLSFEYLLYPSIVLAECARVLKENGVLLISFSNRWFPEKVTKIWQMLHDFERLGYVMKHVSEYYTDIRTFSYRNWPRPYNDPHFFKVQTSDPLYIVTGINRKG
ncbi:MAG: methyltransferase domain-containing protein [Desulfocapsaceae bacterium]|nr:methyltransferase domain-containing protein [Desulfocapsaceae bacterium]